MELILDASSATVVTALAQEGTIVWTGQWLSQNDHTKRLMPEVLRGLAATGSAPSDIEAVVVALGPGPFNGLRVAVAAAKGIAVGAGAAVCGIDTLEAEAARCPPTVSTVRPVLRAGKSAYVTTRYDRDGSAWSKHEDERIVDATMLAGLASEGVPLCGEIDDALAACLQEKTAGMAQVITPHASRTETLALLGHERLLTGATPLATLQPLYARPPHITHPRERRL